MASTNVFDETMSLYIPRVDTRSLPQGNRHAEAEYEAMAADFIGKQFKYQRIGKVSRVDLLKKQTPQGFDYFIAFVHFYKWFDTPQSKALQDEIHTDGVKAKFYFHEMWYWIVNENKAPLTATEAMLHKTIYEQAKQFGLLNEAVNYIKSMKTVSLHHGCSEKQAALQRTAEIGFGAYWTDIMRRIPPPSPLMRSVADGVFGATVSSPEGIPRPPPLARTQSTATVSPAQPPPRPPRPPPLARTQSTATGDIHLTPRDLFGPNAASKW